MTQSNVRICKFKVDLIQLEVLAIVENFWKWTKDASNDDNFVKGLSYL
jgi:hypothetical protein